LHSSPWAIWAALALAPPLQDDNRNPALRKARMYLVRTLTSYQNSKQMRRMRREIRAQNKLIKGETESQKTVRPNQQCHLHI
jgi:hypothetical protein